MARDYKHAKRSSGSGLSGGTGLILGLGMGLAVAAAIYMYDRRPGAVVATAQTAPMATEQGAGAKNAPTPQSAESDTQFDFYDVLPKFEVVVPQKDGGSGGAGGAIDAPGSYVLQAGSYRNFADADRVRAQLALQGVESKIQKVSIDNDTWHRVRIGPISNLNKLEETRRKLREAQVDALVIKLGNQP